MKLTAKKIYDLLNLENKSKDHQGVINFSLMDVNIQIKTKDSVGNILQEWLKAWFIKSKIDFSEPGNTQVFPDFLLDSNDPKKGLLEIKTFDRERGPGFDLANFESYSESLLTDSYRIDSDYLVFGYKMTAEGNIKIDEIWLKKIWELSCPSQAYPVKVQQKKEVIYNLRPGIWYSERVTYKPFASKELFLSALNDTRYQYHQTRSSNSHWLRKVLENYESHTGVKLEVTTA